MKVRMLRSEPWRFPELKRGLCQYAALQKDRFAARSARSQATWGEPSWQPPTSAQLLLRTTMCQSPRL